MMSPKYMHTAGGGLSFGSTAARDSELGNCYYGEIEDFTLKEGEVTK